LNVDGHSGSTNVSPSTSKHAELGNNCFHSKRKKKRKKKERNKQ